jgi:hypothetical protein
MHAEKVLKLDPVNISLQLNCAESVLLLVVLVGARVFSVICRFFRRKRGLDLADQCFDLGRGRVWASRSLEEHERPSRRASDAWCNRFECLLEGGCSWDDALQFAVPSRALARLFG